MYESDSAKLSLPSANSGIIVLLVDDQVSIGKILGKMLETEKDIEFHYFQSAREALKMADTISPTVILQDMVMPEIDGLHMVRYFRAKKATRHTPLIVLSADDNPKVKAEAFALGANDYVVKPPDKIELIARIRYHSRAYRHMMQRNEAYKKLEEQSDELRSANEQLREQITVRKRVEKELLESKKKAEKERETAQAANEKIMESIRYARMIQRSLLPGTKSIQTYLPESFFLWIPRDVVGGDIYFADFSEDGFIIAVIDCTGHGVPGAFMTMIVSSGLKRIIRDDGCRDPAEILNQLNFIVKTTLQQDTENALSDDGLDAAICFVSGKEIADTESEKKYSVLTFAGAKLSLFYFHDNEVHVIKGNKQSIGYKRSDLNFSFTNHTVYVENGISFYMSTDGIMDQLGGENERRFGSGRFKALLKKNVALPFHEQKEIMLQAFNEYKGADEIQDDITVVGFKIPPNRIN